jgi:hypothetical protein
MQQTTACDALYIAVTALFNRRRQPTFCQFSNCGVNPSLLKSSIASTSHRPEVPTTQIDRVVAERRDCFSIGNHHFFASNNDWKFAKFAVAFLSRKRLMLVAKLP